MNNRTVNTKQQAFYRVLLRKSRHISVFRSSRLLSPVREYYKTMTTPTALCLSHILGQMAPSQVRPISSQFHQTEERSFSRHPSSWRSPACHPPVIRLSPDRLSSAVNPAGPLTDPPTGGPFGSTRPIRSLARGGSQSPSGVS